jgi:protein-tyrosine phosphatase
MAECIFREAVRARGLESRYEIDSAATSTDEVGNPIYPPAQKKLREMGVPLSGHRARQMTPEDYARSELLIGMESRNLLNMRRIVGGDPDGKIRRLLDFADHPADIADPWYTGDFDTAYTEILAGCNALLDALEQPKNSPIK